MNRVHPYALILGPIIGIMVFVVMRHPPFSLFIGVVATFGLDYFFKSKEYFVKIKKNDKGYLVIMNLKILKNTINLLRKQILILKIKKI